MLRVENSGLIETLENAMKAERIAAANYGIMLDSEEAFKDAPLLAYIRNAERRHYLLLDSIYWDFTANNYITFKRVATMPRYYPEMIRTSLCDELEAAAFYENLLSALACLRHKEIIALILNDEKEHARFLGKLYENYRQNENGIY
jgi:rubrerythrin